MKLMSVVAAVAAALGGAACQGPSVREGLLTLNETTLENQEILKDIEKAILDRNGGDGSDNDDGYNNDEDGGIASDCPPTYTVFVKDISRYDGAARYDIIMNASPGHPAGRDFDVYSRPAAAGSVDVSMSNSGGVDGDGFFYVFSNWAYFFGLCPTAKTSLVSASGVGTKFVLQIDGNVHRAYLLPGASGDKLKLTSHTGVYRELRLNTSTQRWFVEVYANGQFGETRDLDRQAGDGSYIYSTQREFIDLVVKKEVLDEEGMDW